MTKILVHIRFSVILIPLFLWPAYAIALEEFDKSQTVDDIVIAEMKLRRIIGVAIGIIRNSEVVYTKGYGFSNLKSHTAVTSSTVFNWASNSKPLIAVAAMQLVQDGRLNLDESIRNYIPSLPDHLNSITTRHLLSHQSGIPHYRNGQVIPSGKKIGLLQELDPLNSLNRFIMSPLIFEPGTRTGYSSYAYILLTAVVQAAGNKPIDQQISARIEKPINLKTFQLDMPFENQRNWTAAYKLKIEGVEEVADYPHFWKHGAGGYKSDIQDFSRFALALLNKELIDTTTTEKMWTPQKSSNGQISAYGLGVGVSGSGRNLIISHNGAQEETRTRMFLNPNQKLGIVVMCNTQSCNPRRITTAIYLALLKK